MTDGRPRERIQWFHDQIRAGRFPNSRAQRERFGIDKRTAQRDRDRLAEQYGAPLAYDASRKGFYYTAPDWELPRIPVNSEEILVLAAARQLLSQTAGGYLGRVIRNFGRKLMAKAGDLGLTEARLAESVSVGRHGHSPTSEAIFRKVLDALVHRHPLRITYYSPYSPHSGRTTERTVEPHHLRWYMGSWVMFARCRLRRDWRIFFLARVRSCRVTQEIFTPRAIDEWKSSLDKGFGLYFGEHHEEVRLRLSSMRADLIREGEWHLDQRMEDLPDGGLRLILPVADFAEIKELILGWGADVVVEAPERLRCEVAEEIRRMAEIYPDDVGAE